MKKSLPNMLAQELRTFFAEYVPHTRGLSHHTSQSYRDAFKLLLRFLADNSKCSVVELDVAAISPDAVLQFLDFVERERRCTVATRNARLAAIHSFARFVATRHPEHLEQCQRLLAIPTKRARIALTEYLDEEEVRGIVGSPNRATVDGRRDYALILTFFNTGARVQELLNARPTDFRLDRPAQVLLRGKGQKERVCPLWPETTAVIVDLIREAHLDKSSKEQLFRNHRGDPLTRFGARYILRKYAKVAEGDLPRLASKKVYPHIMRHTAAVHMLQAGVDLVSISHWLGHSSVVVTNRYTAIDLETKRAAIAQAGSVAKQTGGQAWRHDESILTWLESI